MKPREKEDEIKKSLRKMEFYTPGIAFFFRTDPGKIYKEIDNIIARYSPTENMADFPWEEIDVPDIDFLYTQLDNGAIPRRFNFYVDTESEADTPIHTPEAGVDWGKDEGTAIVNVISYEEMIATIMNHFGVLNEFEFDGKKFKVETGGISCIAPQYPPREDKWATLAETHEIYDYLQKAHNMPTANEEIDHPSRYCKGGMECHDAIAAAVSNLVGVQAFDTGQVIRYMWRWADKGGTLDLQKARNYIDYLIKDVEANGVRGREAK